jgi:WD40 repeat protein
VGQLDGTVALYPAEGRPEVVVSGVAGGVAHVAVAPGGQTLAAANFRGEVVLWDRALGQRAVALPGGVHPLSRLEFTGDGRSLLACSPHAPARLIHLETGRSDAVVAGLDASGAAVTLSRDGRTLAITRTGGVIILWDLAAGRKHAEFRGHSGKVWALAFSPDGRTLASGGDDGLVRLWDVAAAPDPVQ